MNIKTIISILAGAILLIVGFTQIAGAEVFGGNYFRRSGTALITVPSSLTIGSVSNRVAGVYTTVLDATNLTISGTSASDLDMGYYDITGAKQVTAGSFIATSTSVVSTFNGSILVDTTLGAGSSASPAIAFGDADSGFYESVDDTISIAIAGNEKYRFLSNQFRTNIGESWAIMKETASVTNPVYLPYLGEGDTGIGGSGNDSISLITAGVNRLEVTNTGVGIGTTIPSTNLHLSGTGASPFLLERTTGGNIAQEFKNTDDSFYIGMGSQEKFHIATGADLPNNSTFTINQTGEVGIGETAPASTLEITSTGTTDLQIMSSGAGAGGRVIVEDTDGAGCTSITALNGVLTASIVTCP